MGYYRETVKGVSWVGAFRMATRGIAIVRTVILIQILSPAQFGIFGIASLAITFLEIFMETGVNVVLIQKKRGIEDYLNTAWVVSILRGFVISLLLILAAPAVSLFFSSPDVKTMIYLISLVSFIRGFINPAIVGFQKNLLFGREFWFRFGVFLVDSAVAILVSFLTKSAVGLVWGLVAGALAELVLSFVFVKPRPRLEFDQGRLREVLSKGKWVTGAGIFQFLFRQGDDAVVGKVLGVSQLGVYQVAYKISSLPISEVTDVVNRVVFPVYARIAKDRVRLKRAFLKTTTTVGAIAFGLGAVLFIFGEQVVTILLGDAWRQVIPLIKILSVFGVVQAVVNSVNSLFLALEKQAYVTLVTFVSTIGLVLSIIPLIAAFGLVGAGLAPLLGAVLAVFLTWREFSRSD
jgi:O-antigen/teichoic acid export membrane protein